MQAYAGRELEIFRHAVNWKRYFLGQMRLFLGGRVLEVGAGMGGTTRVLAEAAHSEWVCLEPDGALAGQIAEAVRTGELPGTVSVRTGGSEGVEEEGAFDAVLYLDVLEHIEDDRAELRRAARLLKEGGRLIVLAPAGPWLFSPFDEAIGHFRRYTRAGLAAAAPAELRLRRLVYLDSAGVLASAANRLLLGSAYPTRAQIEFWDRVLVPVSRLLDRLTGHRFGKSVLGVWQKG